MTALEELLDSPTLPEAAAAIQARLADERERRDRFYDEIRADQKAEFINGEVIMSGPTRDKHLVVRYSLHELLRNFVRINLPGAEVLGEKALCVFPRNDYEPDICFWGVEKAASIDDETLKFPIPDLTVEVLSNTTKHRDRGVKFEDFEAHGVREYWIIDPNAETLEQ